MADGPPRLQRSALFAVKAPRALSSRRGATESLHYSSSFSPARSQNGRISGHRRFPPSHRCLGWLNRSDGSSSLVFFFHSTSIDIACLCRLFQGENGFHAISFESNSRSIRIESDALIPRRPRPVFAGNPRSPFLTEEILHPIMGQIRIPVNFPRTQRIPNQIPDRKRFEMQQTYRVLERSRNGRH
jgi:hypothetical protein